MKYQVLTEGDVEQFIELGYICLKEAYPRRTALEAQDFLWDRISERYPEYGLKKEEPETWKPVLEKDANGTFPTIHLREFFNDPIFKQCETPRLAGAIEDLIGVGRWELKHEPHNWGWWPINFAVGAARPWDVSQTGWHWDGMGRKHFVHSPEQGLLVLPCFSDVASHGGGTFIATGSHKIVSRYLSRFPEGQESSVASKECATEHPWLAELTGKIESTGDRIQKFLETTTVDDQGTELRVIETIAEAGDVMLAHPFMFHAASQNHSGKPRFMCNRAAPLTAPMNLNRADGDYSVLRVKHPQSAELDGCLLVDVTRVVDAGCLSSRVKIGFCVTRVENPRLNGVPPNVLRTKEEAATPRLLLHLSDTKNKIIESHRVPSEGRLAERHSDVGFQPALHKIRF